MKIEDIFELWQTDTNIDRTELGDEALKIPKLHHKYFQIYSAEKLLLKKYEAELGDPSEFLYGAFRSMEIAYVPD